MRSSSPTLLKKCYRILKLELLYGTLLYRYGVSRHRALVESTTRSQTHTYTRFYRSPGQLAALTGPVLEHLARDGAPSKLQINVFASSNGAECFTLASTLLSERPQVDFQIVGSDLHQNMVERANAAVYTYDEVHYWATTSAFVSRTFDKSDGAYVVKPHIRDRVRFVQADLLKPGLVEEFEPGDLVFLQNVLCHLDPTAAKQAFRSAARVMKPRSALFIDGMDLDLRVELTREAALAPLDFQVREIHEAARTHVGERWWNYYYGMAPYASWHNDRVRRFSTIFLKSEPAWVGEVSAAPPPQKAASFTDIIGTLKAYFEHRPNGKAVSPKDALLRSGLADSDAIVPLLGFIEREFGVEIRNTDLVPKNFRTLRTIAKLVSRRSTESLRAMQTRQHE